MNEKTEELIQEKIKNKQNQDQFIEIVIQNGNDYKFTIPKEINSISIIVENWNMSILSQFSCIENVRIESKKGNIIIVSKLFYNTDKLVLKGNIESSNVMKFEHIKELDIDIISDKELVICDNPVLSNLKLKGDFHIIEIWKLHRITHIDIENIQNEMEIKFKDLSVSRLLYQFFDSQNTIFKIKGNGQGVNIYNIYIMTNVQINGIINFIGFANTISNGIISICSTNKKITRLYQLVMLKNELVDKKLTYFTFSNLILIGNFDLDYLKLEIQSLSSKLILDIPQLTRLYCNFISHNIKNYSIKSYSFKVYIKPRSYFCYLRNESVIEINLFKNVKNLN